VPLVEALRVQLGDLGLDLEWIRATSRRSVAALISRATDVDPYFIGKPNPLMMRSALNALGAHSESTTMIGDGWIPISSPAPRRDSRRFSC
jgi:phosphoglycolate phosphatase-like HAD superfamily hydrolase